MIWEIDHTYFDVTLINEHGQLASGSSLVSFEAALEQAQSLAASIKPPSYNQRFASASAQSGADLLEELGL